MIAKARAFVCRRGERRAIDSFRAPHPAIPADVEFLNREAGAFLDAVTEGGKKLD